MGVKTNLKKSILWLPIGTKNLSLIFTRLLSSGREKNQFHSINVSSEGAFLRKASIKPSMSPSSTPVTFPVS